MYGNHHLANAVENVDNYLDCAVNQVAEVDLAYLDPVDLLVHRYLVDMDHLVALDHLVFVVVVDPLVDLVLNQVVVLSVEVAVFVAEVYRHQEHYHHCSITEWHSSVEGLAVRDRHLDGKKCTIWMPFVIFLFQSINISLVWRCTRSG